MTPSRIALLVLGLACAAGCATERQRVSTAPLKERLAELESYTEEGWGLPFRFALYRSDGESSELNEAEQALVEEQLAELRAAYELTPFDFYGAEVELTGSDERASIARAKSSARLSLRLGTRCFGRDAVLDALAESYEWDELGRWYAGEPPNQILRALERDIAKLDRLERRLKRRRGQLALTARAAERREKSGGEWFLTPSEARFARAAQLRAMRALHRALNTCGRWRAAVEDKDFPWPTEALVVSLRARAIHEEGLSDLLEVIVGGRPQISFWRSGFWQRNPLYTALDGQTELLVVDGKDFGTLPEGSVRALLEQRTEGSLLRWYDALDEKAEDPGLAAAIAASSLNGGLTAAWEAYRASRDRIEAGGGVSTASAWRELWDGRTKGGLTVPWAQSVRLVSRFLGSVRLSQRDPAVTKEQLEELEALLAPGDVVLIRQDGYLSNTFLPGFFTHALLYLGPEERWTALKDERGSPLAEDPAVKRALPKYSCHAGKGPARVIEAIGLGVVFSSLKKALGKDYVAVLRPKLSEAQIAAGIRRALVYHGRPYDFEFDFATDDRVVCTELIFRAYSGVIDFGLAPILVGERSEVPGISNVVGRWTLPANDFARRIVTLKANGTPAPFDLLAIYERDPEDDSRPSRVTRGPEAYTALAAAVKR